MIVPFNVEADFSTDWIRMCAIHLQAWLVPLTRIWQLRWGR
jgi:hypothetical protein